MIYIDTKKLKAHMQEYPKRKYSFDVAICIFWLVAAYSAIEIDTFAIQYLVLNIMEPC